MDVISVTPNQSIELEAQQWRLMQDEDEGKTFLTLLEASPTHLKFHPQLAIQYHLAQNEVLPSAVDKVVVGWTPENQSWQLGLFLQNGGASLTWCELATWQMDQSPAKTEIAAKTAARALSQVLNSPLQVVEQQVLSSDFVQQVTQPSAHTAPLQSHMIELKPLPLVLGDWMLRNSAEGLVWQVTGRWLQRYGQRVVFFLGGLVVFIFLAIGSLESGLAPVSPDWLPYVGFGVALVLFFSAAENLWRIIMRRQVVVDDLAQEIRSEHLTTGFVDWRIPYEQIECIIVSQESAHPQGRRSRQDPMNIAQDAWVHIAANQTFYLIAEQPETIGKSWKWETVRRREAADTRYPLDLSEYDTPLHHAVQHLAKHLNVPIWIDIR